MHPRGTTTSKEALALFRAIEEFRKLDDKLPSQTIATFVYVCLHEPATMKQIGEALAYAQSTTSRNVMALSKVNRLREPGLGLVEAKEDFYERRRKLVTLTPKGRRLLDELLYIMKR